jgi:hypothetical protein
MFTMFFGAALSADTVAAEINDSATIVRMKIRMKVPLKH